MTSGTRVGREQLEAAVDEVRTLVSADGADLDVLTFDEATADLRIALVLDGVECLDCVLPPALLDDMVRQMIRRALPEIGLVTVVDPRSAGVQ